MTRKPPGPAALLDGKAVAARMLASLPERVNALSEHRGAPPLLAIVAIGADSPSEAYLKHKLHACRSAGIETSVHSLPRGTSEAEAFQVLDDLADNHQVDGILLEVPVPEPLDARRLLDRLPPEKDVEGVTVGNFGGLLAAHRIEELDRRRVFVPCTAAAILALIRESGMDPSGRRAVVVGRSNIVGKPTAHLLTCLDATVTLCHSRTQDLGQHTRTADILVCAAGRPGLVTGAMLKPGCVVVDAGVRYEGDVPRGDLELESARRVAAAVTPVPGGVGPVTVATLLANTVLAAERRSAALPGAEGSGTRSTRTRRPR